MGAPGDPAHGMETRSGHYVEQKPRICIQLHDLAFYSTLQYCLRSQQIARPSCNSCHVKTIVGTQLEETNFGGQRFHT